MTLLIVDDEIHIRMGLKNSILWSDYGIDTVLVAENGIEALELCHRYHPELVITDIQMPGMNGLELSQNIVDLYDPVKILVLTGHSEFEYAKAALKVGVVDYLLKPVNIPELKNTVKSSIQEINHILERQKNIAEFKHLNQESSIENIFETKNMDNSLARDTLMNHLKIQNKQLFVIAAYSIDSVYTTEMHQVCLYIEKELLGSSTSVKQYKLYHKNGIIYSLIPVLSTNDWIRKSNQLIEDITITNRLLENQFHTSMSFCSSSVNDLSQITELWQEVNLLLSNRLYLGGKMILTKTPSTTSNQINFNLINTTYITEKINLFDYESLHVYFKELFDQYRDMKLVNSEVVRTSCTTLKQLLITTLLSKGIDIAAILELNETLLNKIPEYKTLTEYENWIDNLYFLILSGLSSRGDKKHNRVIAQAIDYIYQNYDKNISLDKVAEYVNKSKNYFCYLFKKEVGISYVEYLNQVRIEKAKALLLTSDELTYEIAEHVGYSDYKYFSSMFKKYTGISPSQFRKSE